MFYSLAYDKTLTFISFTKIIVIPYLKLQQIYLIKMINTELWTKEYHVFHSHR